MKILMPSAILSDEELANLFALEEVPSEYQQQVREVLNGTDRVEIPEAFSVDEEPAPAEVPSAEREQSDAMRMEHGQASEREVTQKEEDDERPVQFRIDECTLPQKIKLAMFGNGAARAALIRDSSKLVQMFVLRNPRIQLREIEEFSRNPNLSEHVLRAVGSNQSWTKSYVVKTNLVFNPKTPSDIALKWVRYLNNPEIRKLAKSKNVPQVIVTVARRKLEETAR